MTLGTTSCMHFLHSFLVPEATEDLQTKLSRICEESPRTAKNHTDQRRYRHTLYHSPTTTRNTNHKPPSPKCGGGGVYAAWRLQYMFFEVAFLSYATLPTNNFVFLCSRTNGGRDTATEPGCPDVTNILKNKYVYIYIYIYN